MKQLAPYLMAVTLALSAAVASAESTVKLSGVHLCCKACVNGVTKALAKTEGVKAEVDQSGGTVTLTAADQATAQKGGNALVKAGYYGTSSDVGVKLPTVGKLPEGKVKSLKVEGVHLCCGSCVKAVNKALGEVSGVTANTAEKNAKTFEVTGDFSAKDVFSALNKAGLTGKAGK